MFANDSAVQFDGLGLRIRVMCVGEKEKDTSLNIINNMLIIRCLYMLSVSF